MIDRGLLKEHFYKNLSKYLQWGRNKCEFSYMLSDELLRFLNEINSENNKTEKCHPWKYVRQADMCATSYDTY